MGQWTLLAASRAAACASRNCGPLGIRYRSAPPPDSRRNPTLTTGVRSDLRPLGYHRQRPAFRASLGAVPGVGNAPPTVASGACWRIGTPTAARRLGTGEIVDRRLHRRAFRFDGPPRVHALSADAAPAGGSRSLHRPLPQPAALDGRASSPSCRHGGEPSLFPVCLHNHRASTALVGKRVVPASAVSGAGGLCQAGRGCRHDACRRRRPTVNETKGAGHG